MSASSRPEANDAAARKGARRLFARDGKPMPCISAWIDRGGAPHAGGTMIETAQAQGMQILMQTDQVWPKMWKWNDVVDMSEYPRRKEMKQ